MKLRKRIRLLTIAVRSKNEQLTRKDAVIVELRTDLADRDERLEAARLDWKATRASIVEARNMHKSVDRPRALGRAGAVEKRCAICTNRLFPCPTYSTLNRILEGHRS